MVRIIQLTDPHLFRDPRDRLRGVPTNESFEEVLAAAVETVPDSDLCVVSGDLAQDEHIDTYRLLRKVLAPLSDRVRVVPGNHDRPEAMREVFGDLIEPDTSWIGFVARHDDVTVVGLDSHVPGAVHGEVGGDQLAWLEGIVSEGNPLVVFVHHPPAPIGTTWLDGMGLLDSDELLQVLRASDKKVTVVHGHTHQASHSTVDGDIAVFGTPSTAFQFAPGGRPGETDHEPPGFRVLDVASGAVETRVHRLSTTRFPPESD